MNGALSDLDRLSLTAAFETLRTARERGDVTREEARAAVDDPPGAPLPFTVSGSASKL